jgi:hypothetical protein
VSGAIRWVASAFWRIMLRHHARPGVDWAPKLVAVRGFDAATANWAASLLWLGLAAGRLTVPKWSDIASTRKFPIIVGTVVQVCSLAALLYLPQLGLAFGAGNAAHMLAFSTASGSRPLGL